MYFRIYGPEQAALDGSWKPGDLEEIEESVQDHSSHPPGIHGIREWEQEMSDYENVDPENRLRYHNTESELRVEEKMRMEDFLHHHQIWDKFITADADGER